MQLSYYPTAIAKAAKTVQQLDQNIANLKAAVDRMNYAIEITISQDENCKNDQQRRARRMELQHQPAYTDATEALQKMTWEREAAQIDLDCLRHTFRVETLEKRERIARMEANQLIA